MKHLRRPASPLIVASVVSILAVCGPRPSLAASHRAHLSSDLVRAMAAGDARIDVIVGGDAATVQTLATRYNGTVAHLMPNGAVLRLTAGELDALSRDPSVDQLSGDSVVQSTWDVTNETIGADQLWTQVEPVVDRLGGRGIGVAVIDSGIDQVGALRGRVLANFDFVDGRDGVPIPDDQNDDQYGHGTHVAGLIAGQPSGFVDGGPYSGVAPDAYLVNLRVLGADGSGKTSDVIDAVDWVIAHGRRYGIRVINLSLGHPVYESYRQDPLCQAVERAVAAGFVVVTAAGNMGMTTDGRMIIGGITSPGDAPDVITVGALDTHQTSIRSDDTVAPFSSRGPTAFDGVLKPDLVAPGTHVVSLEAPGSYLARTYPQFQVAGRGRDAYFELSGTSQATAVTSGAVALLLEREPRLRPSQVKLLLQLSATYLPAAGLIGGGAGSLNVLAAADLARDGLTGGLPTTTIAGESVTASGIAFEIAGNAQAASRTGAASVVWGIHALASASSVVWGIRAVTPQSVVWGVNGVGSLSVVWGISQSSAQSVVWGVNGVSANCVVWGVTGTTSADCVVWGVTGSTSADCVVWGIVL